MTELATSHDATQLNRSVPSGILSNSMVVAQSVGMLAPTVGAASLVPIAYQTAGGAAWLTVLIATGAVFAIGFVISVLSRRYVSAGAMYAFIPKGLGPAGGLVAAGMLAMLGVAGGVASVLACGASLAQFADSTFGIGHSSRAELILIDLIALALAATLIFLGIKVATKALLLLEVIGITVIVVLLIVLVVKHGSVIDPDQLRLRGANTHGVFLGLTILIAAFGGFESGAALGLEARNPRQAVPLAVMGSALIVGLFFMANIYIQVLAYRGTGLNLGGQAVPLGAIADHYGVAWLGDIVLLGVALSWFASLCGLMVYVSRLVFSMANEGVIPKMFARTSKKTGTPVAASVLWIVLFLAVCTILFVGGADLSVAFGGLATVGGWALSVAYLLMGLAAIRYAIRQRWTISFFMAAALVASTMMVLEFWNTFNPLPDFPPRVYLWVFVGVVATSLILAGVTRIFFPGWLRKIGRVPGVATTESSTE